MEHEFARINFTATTFAVVIDYGRGRNEEGGNWVTTSRIKMIKVFIQFVLFIFKAMVRSKKRICHSQGSEETI